MHLWSHTSIPAAAIMDRREIANLYLKTRPAELIENSRAHCYYQPKAVVNPHAVATPTMLEEAMVTAENIRMAEEAMITAENIRMAATTHDLNEVPYAYKLADTEHMMVDIVHSRDHGISSKFMIWSWN